MPSPARISPVNRACKKMKSNCFLLPRFIGVYMHLSAVVLSYCRTLVLSYCRYVVPLNGCHSIFSVNPVLHSPLNPPLEKPAGKRDKKKKTHHVCDYSR